ncbi:related to PCL5-cyclin [Ustilago bromivora]|uniref:Related to PCL5 - cyclin n=1 Tax=Ustilago bromivora TaxID=307758 RepID=A0A1K0GHW2_9BASI|nr:related to PCL5-cyclin [Ustilago bromivora]SYW80996.1 related to PCL5 - cyclin [Ustilago bromivora]
MQPLGPFAVDGITVPIADYVELNGFNLASHTTALEQSVLGKPHLSSTNTNNGGLTLMPPTVCGKRSRSNSTSSSAASSHASVFSCSENDLFESGYETQTTSLGEQTPSSRKSSMSESSSQQIEHDLASWHADLLAASQEEQQRCAKRLRHLQGEVLRLANQVVSTAGKQPVQAAAPVASAPAPLNNTSGISPSSSASSSLSSASDDTKNSLVDSLIDAAVRTLDAIWNASTPSESCDLAKGNSALPLQVFIRETLRRARASCSTLQASLLYCVRLGEACKRSRQMSLRQSTRAAGVQVEVEAQSSSPLHGMNKEELCLTRCPRRMFLASIMVASKFVQDRTYSNRAWAKISGLPAKDLGKLERAFLKAIDYRLMTSYVEWDKWTAELAQSNASVAETSSNNGVAGRRSSLSRSQSDNVTGVELALDTELRAASPRLPSQVQPKYRHLSDAQQQSQPRLGADISLPFPRAAPAVVSAEI